MDVQAPICIFLSEERTKAGRSRGLPPSPAHPRLCKQPAGRDWWEQGSGNGLPFLPARWYYVGTLP
jgi:hypothetical protein